MGKHYSETEIQEVLSNEDIDYDDTFSKIWMGENGIQYEYVIPLAAYKAVGPENAYKVALDVKSHKGDNKRPSRSKETPGKIYRRGQYQPIGNKSVFTFYEYKQIWEEMQKDKDTKLQFERQAMRERKNEIG